MDKHNLLEMLTYKRPAFSQTLQEFLSKYIHSIEGAWQDSYGNTFVQVGNGGTTLFTAHTDTVHRTTGTQRVTTDKWTAWVEDSECLGADDTVGIYMLKAMIEAGVVGTYAFFQEEEIGGLGSEYVVEQLELKDERYDFLRQMTKCISLDRMGYKDIVTHQGSRCCTDAFANSLAYELGQQGLEFLKDDTGIFTDSAQFVGIIPECTNLSVGYHKQHTTGEWVDLEFVETMTAALIRIDWEGLIVEGVEKDVYDTAFSSRYYYDDDYPASYAEDDFIEDAAIVNMLEDKYPLVFKAIMTELQGEENDY